MSTSNQLDGTLLWSSLAVAMVIGFALLATDFSFHQAIWVDETTQLFGLSLPLDEQFKWLSGSGADYGGVPPDRAPPLSYLFGDLWTGFSGRPEELPLRIAGIVAFAGGAPPIWMAARRLSSPLGALFALALVYLSPAMMVQAVEIRPYPLFFFFSCWALWAYVKIVTNSLQAHIELRLVTVFLVMASYSHFFGVVLASCLYLSILILKVSRAQPILATIVSGGAIRCLLRRADPVRSR